ncbi:putative G-patch domain containing protein [Blattamonas nauphoetae]|uniref:G-patch domain containing protein n=1 Tax=Blattamonas nauphoetae TaxID=2049346 RepID=A0ABQ9Y6T3_9EUKA|nr:putative G-patch domain containing protein [Blattamonas nauphoetae]
MSTSKPNAGFSMKLNTQKLGSQRSQKPTVKPPTVQSPIVVTGATIQSNEPPKKEVLLAIPAKPNTFLLLNTSDKSDKSTSDVGMNDNGTSGEGSSSMHEEPSNQKPISEEDKLLRQKAIDSLKADRLSESDTLSTNQQSTNPKLFSGSSSQNQDETASFSIPFGQFGLAMLRGMGWTDGKPIGKGATTVTKVVEYDEHIGRLGLGADKLSGFRKEDVEKIQKQKRIEMHKDREVKAMKTEEDDKRSHRSERRP